MEKSGTLEKVKLDIDESRDTLKELMLEVVASQNADGSFREEDMGLRTSYFIIAMILYKEENKPYAKQIKKAIFYLMNQHENSIEAYIAMKLAYKNDIYKQMEIEDRIKIIDKKDIEGSSKYLYNRLIRDTKKFSSILFNESLDKKELIEHLFKKI